MAPDNLKSMDSVANEAEIPSALSTVTQGIKEEKLPTAIVGVTPKILCDSRVTLNSLKGDTTLESEVNILAPESSNTSRPYKSEGGGKFLDNRNKNNSMPWTGELGVAGNADHFMQRLAALNRDAVADVHVCEKGGGGAAVVGGGYCAGTVPHRRLLFDEICALKPAGAGRCVLAIDLLLRRRSIRNKKVHLHVCRQGVSAETTGEPYYCKTVIRSTKQSSLMDTPIHPPPIFPTNRA